MRQGGLILSEGRCVGFEKIGNKNTKKSAPPTTHHEIHNSPATANTSRRRATKHVPRVSPYSHASSIHPGFVEIGLAGIHTYVYTRTAAAAAAPPVYVLVLYSIYSLASAASSFSAVILVCISGFGVVRWCLKLSFS